MGWVVIAWRETVMEPVEGTGRADLGQRPRMMPQWRPCAVVWARSGSAADVESAKRHMQAHRLHGGAVYQYPADEADPIGRAKREVMQ